MPFCHTISLEAYIQPFEVLTKRSKVPCETKLHNADFQLYIFTSILKY